MKYLILVLALLSSSAYSVVNYRNGNYYQKFIDAEVLVDKTTFQFSRVYNSASNYDGIFGRGWGSTFETTVNFIDNAIIINEWGNGPQHVFVPKGATLEKTLEKSLQKIQQKTKLTGEKFEAYKARILLDPQALEDEVGASAPPMATSAAIEYQNLNNPFMKLTLSKTGVDFKDSEGIEWKFDPKGKLLSWSHPKGLSFETKHDQHGLSMLFSAGLTIQFERTNSGAVKTIKVGKTNLRYKVVDGFIAQSIDQNNLTYDYMHENNKLVSVSGSDLSEKISYAPSGEVQSLLDTDGNMTKYKFTFLAGDHPFKRVEISTDKTKEVFEYEDRIGKLGPYLYRRKITQGTKIEEIIFDECCGRPLSVKKEGSNTEYKYNDAGLPLYMKTADGKTYQWTWDERGQIQSFISPVDRREFSYDKGKLVKVVSSQKGTVTMTRDASNRILSASFAASSGSTKLHKFTYGPDSKTMTYTSPSGKVLRLTVSPSGTWETDSKQNNNLSAQMDLLAWYSLHKDLILPPTPEGILPII